MSKSYSLSDLKFISASTLRKWFVNKTSAGHRFAVVDVRDNDYVGGHIKGCYHYPANNFIDTLPDLRQKLYDNKIQSVVFHCMLSQARGPSSTLKFLRSLDEVQDDDQRQFFGELDVYVLQGGFTQWVAKYGDDSSVTEGFSKDVWDYGGSA